MTDLALTAPTITRQAIEAKGRTAPLKVTGKLRAALDFMVWECLKRPEAAAKAGLSDHGLREALRRPHVRAHYLGLIEVLRTSEKARSIQRMVDIRDAADNMPAFQAAKYLLEDQTETAARSTGSLSLPGLTIQIINAPANADPAVNVIDHE